MYNAVKFQPIASPNKIAATSFTIGEVIKNAIVTPSGIPELRKAIKRGIEEHEQKGVTAPKITARKYAIIFGLPSSQARTFSEESKSEKILSITLRQLQEKKSLSYLLQKNEQLLPGEFQG